MFADLNDAGLQPDNIKEFLIPEIELSDDLMLKLKNMFSEEEKEYCKIRRTTSVVQTDKSYVFFSNQWFYLAVMCKKYAQALYKYCDFFDNHMRTDDAVMQCIKSNNYSGAAYSNLFDVQRDKEYMTKFIDGNSDFRPGKNLINGGNKVRSCKDIFGSCVLGKINVPNASSSYLGNLIYYLCKRPALYDEVENEILQQVKLSDSVIFLPSSVKDCAKAIVDYIYDFDSFSGIMDRIEVMDQNIKINTSNLTALFPDGNWLRYMFARPSSSMYDLECSDSKPRVFDREYVIRKNEQEYKCRLTTEWVGTAISARAQGTQGNNYLQALIKIVSFYYSDVLRIEENNGKYYLYPLKRRFQISSLQDSFDSHFAKRYITSLLAKPFVILTGNSGTGKTRIAKQFAEYLEKTDNGEKNWIIVPVGADWTDNTKILGYYNPLEEKYVPTPILNFILQAEKNPEIPYFLILDEMNLSQVERYFSDFLSAMESGEEIPLYEPSVNNSSADGKKDTVPEKISIPGNLFVTGTVNIDETTYMFSPKVLDRSNVIEFRPEKKNVLDLLTSGPCMNNITPAGYGMAEGFIALSNDIRNGLCEVEHEKMSLIRNFLDGIYEDLQTCGFEFAYRTVKEIRQYFAAAYELNKDNFNLTETMDEQIVQKVLPKIYGDKRQIGDLLEKIEQRCNRGIDDGSEEKMTLSLKKIGQMKYRLDKYQYASFI